MISKVFNRSWIPPNNILQSKRLCDYYGITLAEFFEGVEKSPDIR